MSAPSISTSTSISIYDAARVRKIRHPEPDGGRLFAAHRASGFMNLTRSGPFPTEAAIRILPVSSGVNRTCDKTKHPSRPTSIWSPTYVVCRYVSSSSDLTTRRYFAAEQVSNGGVSTATVAFRVPRCECQPNATPAEAQQPEGGRLTHYQYL